MTTTTTRQAEPHAAAFPGATREDWLALVRRARKGADEPFAFATLDGFTLDALPPRMERAVPLPGRAGGAPWSLIARIDDPDLPRAAAQALDDLGNGATGLVLVLGGSPTAYGAGLPHLNPAVLDDLFRDVVLDAISLRLETGARWQETATFADWAGSNLAALDLSLGVDPLGAGAAGDWDRTAHALAGLVRDLQKRGLRGDVLLADGRPHHAAGASPAQELAAVLVTALAYLRALEAGGVDIAAAPIGFALAADADQFETMAKFRAFRLLWARIAEDAGLSPAPPHLHAETAWRSMTRRGAYQNLLRATIAAFAAGTAGADSVTVLPFTQPLGLPDAHARRLARNIQTLLLEESHAHWVADPGAGAGAIEAFTEATAAAAWERFRDIERAGGMPVALASGAWQQAVAATRAERIGPLEARREVLIGATEFVADETPPAVLSPPAAGAPQRLAEPFEEASR